MTMASLSWGSLKLSKVEGIPLDEIRWLQKLLQQGMENVSILECNSEALKATLESQTYMAQKLQQEMRRCNLQNILTDKETQPEETNNSWNTGCPGDARRTNREHQGHKQVPDRAYQAGDMHHGTTDSDVSPSHKQHDLHESTGDILVKLLLNNQNVLMNQAVVIQKAVKNNICWLKNLQQEVDIWFSQNSESLNELDKRCKALEEEKNELSKKCKEVEEEKNQLSKKCKEVQVEKNELSKKCKEVEEEKNQLSTKCKEVEDEKYYLSTKCKELEEVKKELEKEIETLKKDCDKLSTENNYLKNLEKRISFTGGSCFPSFIPQPKQKPVTAQVYCPRNSDLMTNVVSELSNTLQLQMSSYNLDFAMQMCESPSNINRSLPVIVICLNASRLGTDVSNALQGVPVGSNVAVLILHHKDIHALPTQSSDRVLTGSEYKNVGAIIDMAYLTNKGMYTCDMNNRALETLKDFIQTHSHP